MRSRLALLLLALCASSADAQTVQSILGSNVPISGLPTAGAITGSEALPIVQSGTTRKLTVTGLAQYMRANLQVSVWNSGQGNYASGTSYDPFGPNVRNNSNTASGIGAMGDNTSLDSNAAFGTFALLHNQNAMNAAFGARAGMNATRGHKQSTFMGSNAGMAYTDGGGSVAVGHGAVGGDDFTPVPAVGILNTNVGSWSGQEYTTAQEETCVGVDTCMNHTTSQGSVALGAYALAGTSSNTATNVGNSSSFSVGIGHSALRLTTKDDQVAVGHGVLSQSIDGTHNVGAGAFTLSSSQHDSNNTGFGDAVLALLNGGNDDTGIGSSALVHVTTGSGNTASGSKSGYGVTTGSNNTFNGANTAATITTGSGNTIMGANVSGLPANLTNAIILAAGNGTILADFGLTNSFQWNFAGGATKTCTANPVVVGGLVLSC